ncbi:5-methyltetrahydropteroyltriglutamate--homocysteine S-methyltransferase [Alicyclobacillus acidocaldarius]|uniref:5-methyltetrahydropteroyltriglutamate--homocysteine methyltransferase n=1 Tax=Alicyclobacillus acidocaldarius subsp. acidocaldarius (strain ATCC 27009 / DSM 446 / BCRC 14685 / JCM 5260 / KCTC 1825 / NBRC 15652 / NCIMB 11725 / NRRL B-14509 / 104-IA) TaxID=521098 RepID=C8WU41_ALIAD|nr:5-methyltetrahydropteroyltriglutamate--homocysteine S-methyltransferase [Alicyclobacillus acidocaldarius]ACV57804.1 5-methyltetrahydropteroyltriglutamate/homocystei neS-methyltransferase [Alicyclobacillus acidocaldarius subsp. acidocaldarius DSM 446]
MAITASIGFPRMGPRRELKRMVEQFWQGKIGEDELTARAAELRKLRWQVQRDRGVEWIVANDFSFYDHVLDAACLFQAVPERFRALPSGSLQQYFAMARGTQDATALEMTKWFDTNYHYLVPELEPKQVFTLGVNKPLNEYLEAKALGFDTVPQLVGPITFLKLSKVVGGDVDPLSLLPNLIPAYEAWFASLREAGAAWVQLDEPALVLDLTDAERQAFVDAYAALAKVSRPNILVATYFGSLGDNLATALELPVEGLHLDLVRGPDALQQVHALGWPKGRRLSLGVIDGRNVWRADLDTAFAHLEQGVHLTGAEHVMIAPSCSLLHVPWDVELESDMDPEIKSWLAFALQKLDEIALLKRALDEGRAAVEAQLEANRALLASRRASARLNREDVRARLDEVKTWKLDRQSPHAVRKEKQASRFKLPLLPTTTIGSFPQTQAVRDARAKWRKGEWTTDEYEAYLRSEIRRWIDIQEEIGLDVLVHGEFERTDMVEYFGEMLDGFVFTKHGWVQSYGSRCVKPPIIYGDVARPAPMTVRWSTYAQSLTEKPVKGMLTGPVTILQWSFVRDDIPRAETCRQIALAIRDEVLDLEAAGIGMIQIDEPALREGLPLRRADWEAYLGWAVECFRIASSGVRDETQIHTHMCYAEFNDIMPAIQAMDADVISIETSRSHMELLKAFEHFRYENDIGPGVYDIHSPRVPSVDEMVELLRKAASVIRPEQLWVNPDCGLKTRGEPETVAALRNMVDAAQRMRASLSQPVS